jgi:hypothetical protein
MTLLIGTVSRDNVVLTSDGLSTLNPITGQGISSNEYKKIFPIQDVPIVIAHHGLNILNKRDVSDVINDFMVQEKNLIKKSSLKIIADALVKFIDHDARLTLQNPNNKGGIGFWIAGFGWGKSKPALYEVFWPDETVPFSHENLVIGGDGKELIKPYLNMGIEKFHPKKVNGYNINFAIQHHDILYKTAESKQTMQGKKIFGGEKYQLFITKKEWKWTIGQP